MCIYLDKYMHTEGVFLRAKIEFIIAVIILAGLWFLNQNITGCLCVKRGKGL